MNVIEHNNINYYRTGSGGHGTPDGALNYIIYSKSKNVKHSEFIYICENSNVILRQYQYNDNERLSWGLEGIELLYYKL